MQILIIICLILCAINALENTLQIKRGETVNHTLDEGLYLLFCTAISYMHPTILEPIVWGINWSPLFVGLVVSTIVRLGFFNFLLYEMRGLPLSYESLTTTSTIDKIFQAVKNWIKDKTSITIYDWQLSVLDIIATILLFILKK